MINTTGSEMFVFKTRTKGYYTDGELVLKRPKYPEYVKVSPAQRDKLQVRTNMIMLELVSHPFKAAFYRPIIVNSRELVTKVYL